MIPEPLTYANTRSKASWKPTPDQELLLRACLLQADTAIDAWNSWKARVDINALDPGSQRLLPLLHHNLRGHVRFEDIDGKLKGAYRETWYKNQLLFHRAARLIERLHEAGIRTLVFKGPSLTVLYYGDLGLRPMNDFDLLVRKEDVVPAIATLKLAGWVPVADICSHSVEFIIGMQNGLGFYNVETRAELDLHWHAFFECPREDFDRELWSRSKMVELRGIHTRALDTTDELIYVCLHGSRKNQVPPIRWVADVYTILKTSASKIDWDRIARVAVNERIVLPLKETLTYFQIFAPECVPAHFLRALQRKPAAMERIERWSGEIPASKMRKILGLWFYVSRKERTSTIGGKLMGFFRYMQLRWKVDKLWKLPGAALRKIVKIRSQHRRRGLLRLPTASGSSQ